LHHTANFAMLVPREVDPVAAAARIPLPPEKPPLTGEANARTSLPKQAILVQERRSSQADELGKKLHAQSRGRSGCSGTSHPGRHSSLGRIEPNHRRSASPVVAGADCGPDTKADQTKEVIKHVLSGLVPSTERKPSATWRREN